MIRTTSQRIRMSQEGLQMMPTFSVKIGEEWVPIDRLSQDQQDLIRRRVAEALQLAIERQIAIMAETPPIKEAG